MEAGKPELASYMVMQLVLMRVAKKNNMTKKQLMELTAGPSRRACHDDNTVVVIYLKGK